MKSVMDCHGIEVEEMGGSVRHEQVDLCPHKSWHLEGDCQLTEDHIQEVPEGMMRCEGISEVFKDAPPPLGPGDQTKSTNPKDVLAREEQRVPLHLIPGTALVQLALALGDGAEKYGPYNWREEGVSASVYTGAAERHLRAWYDREEDAQDSRRHHLGHAMACLAIILDAQAVGNLVDDRPAPAPTSEMMEEVKATGGVGGEEEDPVAGLAPYVPSGEALKEKLQGEYHAHCDVPPEDRI